MQKVVGSSPISRLESPPNWQLSHPGAPLPHDAESRGFECPQRLEILQIPTISHGTLSRSNAEGPEFERATAGPEMPCTGLLSSGRPSSRRGFNRGLLRLVDDWLTQPRRCRSDRRQGQHRARLAQRAKLADRPARRTNYIPIWLNRPIEALADDKPVELLTRGDYQRAAQLMAELEYPGVT
jgi:hypothetical protein